MHTDYKNILIDRMQGGVPMDIDLKIFNILTDEQKEAVMTAQTPEELIALAKEQGYELTDEDMMAVATGWHCSSQCHIYKTG